MYEELVMRLRNCATEAAPCKTCDMTEDSSCSDTLMKQAADAIEKLSKDRDKWEATAKEERAAYWHWCDNYQKDVPRWISVKDKLPQVAEWVLAMSDDYILPVEVFRGDSCWMDVLMHEVSVTHWMPLPEPPKEET